MSVTEAQTGRSSVQKMLRRKLTSSKYLFLGKSRIKTGNRSFEVCRHNGSNCTCNVTEISVQSCEEKIRERASPTEGQRHYMSPEAHRSDQHQLIQKLNALKQVFSCFTCTLKPGEGGSHDDGEYHAVTILNRHTRDSVDLNTTEIHQFSNAGYKSTVEKREASKSETFKPLNRLQSKAKSSNSLRVKAFWRQKPKKPSPFFQERIGETEEYIAEEIIILANEHADESINPNTYLETEGKHHCPLTVSVDVTAMKLEINNEESEASKTSSHGSNDMEVMVGNPDVRVMGSGETQMIPQSLEDSCLAQNSTVSPDHGHSQNVDNLRKQQSTPNLISWGAASEHPAVKDDIRLYAAFNSDSFSIHHNAAAVNGPLGNKITASTVTDDVTDASDGSFFVMMVYSEHNAEQQCEKRELFLLETACSVVQVAIKSALKQFKDELLGTSAHLDPH
ncbi:uncharacterized protein LOC141783158 isoform X1 [Sebastes fasciatus]|uniref:uncharacterized protein LOC141783158 isoform X1 n=2 Tax=Sebastes fasciatus TaxID=394691 RepID=UPI003D9E638F